MGRVRAACARLVALNSRMSLVQTETEHAIASGIGAFVSSKDKENKKGSGGEDGIRTHGTLSRTHP